MRRMLSFTAAVAALGCACRGGGPLADPNTAVTPETHTFFPILTGNHAGIDCNSCHGQFDSFKQADCLTCHTQPQCDPVHLGMPGYAFQNPKCITCHPDGTVNIDHTLFFPIATGQIHAGIACSTCHTDPANKKSFDCVSCHTQATTDPWHSGVSGYAWSSPQCFSCHPTSNVPDFPHPSFPIAAGATHANAGCGKCHTDPANLTAIDCVTCHPSATNQPKHANVGGFSSTTAACLRCHGDSQVNTVVSHLPFAISPTGRHYLQSCVRCHPNYRTDKTFAADFSYFNCLTCHSGIHNGQYTQSTTCVQSGCHPTGGGR